MEVLNSILAAMVSFLFGPIMLFIFLGTGIFLTVRTRGIQFRKFGAAFKALYNGRKKNQGEGEINSLWAFAASLSACVGVANIAGVAAAIAVGGPGAIFWMWMAAIIGMATKYCEIVLALHFREKDQNGDWRGGAMYVLSRGMKNKPLGRFLGCFFAIAASFVGLVSCNMLQTNSVVSALSAYHIPGWAVGLIFAILTAMVVIGGVKRLGRVTSVITPVMGIIYMLAGLVVLVLNANHILPAFGLIFKSAFSAQAAVGGFSGAAFQVIMRIGVSRGIMSNEAGLGSSAMIHATAQVEHPTDQGILGIMEVFFDTIVICTMTALVILTTGVWNSGLTSAALSNAAFSAGLPGEWGGIIVAVATVLFCFSTLLSWFWYGETGAVFVFGAKAAPVFRVLWVIFAFLGSIVNIGLVWNAADTVNGLMFIPNLISLWIFHGVVIKLTNQRHETHIQKRTNSAQ